jgi:hypothetical protein
VAQLAPGRVRRTAGTSPAFTRHRQLSAAGRVVQRTPAVRRACTVTGDSAGEAAFVAHVKARRLAPQRVPV